MQSLEKISGEPLGIDLVAWEKYVKATTSDSISPTLKSRSPIDDYLKGDAPTRSGDNSFQPKADKSWQTSVRPLQRGLPLTTPHFNPLLFGRLYQFSSLPARIEQEIHRLVCLLDLLNADKT